MMQVVVQEMLTNGNFSLAILIVGVIQVVLMVMNFFKK